MKYLTVASLAAALTMIAGAATAQSYGPTDPAFADTSDPNSAPVHDWTRPGWQRGRASRGYNAYARGGYSGGYDAYARSPYRFGYQAQSGGTGSPVSAGSSRGSTDRSPPNSPFASGPYGDGERY